MMTYWAEITIGLERLNVEYTWDDGDDSVGIFPGVDEIHAIEWKGQDVHDLLAALDFADNPIFKRIEEKVYEFHKEK